MKRPGDNDGAAAAQVYMKWGLVLLLAAGAGGLVYEAALGASASGDVSAGRGAEVFAVMGRIDGDDYGIFLVDPSNGTICLYRWDAGDEMLKLLAARTYTFDTQLDDYNTEPAPREIQTLVGQGRRLESAAPQQ